MHLSSNVTFLLTPFYIHRVFVDIYTKVLSLTTTYFSSSWSPSLYSSPSKWRRTWDNRHPYVIQAWSVPNYLIINLTVILVRISWWWSILENVSFYFTFQMFIILFIKLPLLKSHMLFSSMIRKRSYIFNHSSWFTLYTLLTL